MLSGCGECEKAVRCSGPPSQPVHLRPDGRHHWLLRSPGYRRVHSGLSDSACAVLCSMQGSTADAVRIANAAAEGARVGLQPTWSRLPYLTEQFTKVTRLARTAKHLCHCGSGHML